MRIAWMISRHLAKYGIRIRLDVGRHAPQNSGDRILVRLRPGLPFLPRCRRPRENSDDAKQSDSREITRLRLPSKPAATASGWRAGSRRAG
jgi:hypothetical protein